jgi:hypothetical protein
MTDESVNKGWHTDRRIPVALLMAIAVQFGGFIWWAAGTSSSVDFLIQTQKAQGAVIGSNTVRIRANENLVGQNGIRFTSIKQSMGEMKDAQKDMQRAQEENNALLRQILRVKRESDK